MSVRCVKRDSEQLVRGVEHAVVQHAVEREVRFDLRFVEVVLRLAHLLGVVLPIPRLERRAVGVAIDQTLNPLRLAVAPWRLPPYRSR